MDKVEIKSADGKVFSLEQTRMVERDIMLPYSAARGDVRRALLSPSRAAMVRYKMGKSVRGHRAFLVKHSGVPDFSVGCALFEGEQAAELRRWALSAPPSWWERLAAFLRRMM